MRYIFVSLLLTFIIIGQNNLSFAKFFSEIDSVYNKSHSRYKLPDIDKLINKELSTVHITPHMRIEDLSSGKLPLALSIHQNGFLSGYNLSENKWNSFRTVYQISLNYNGTLATDDSIKALGFVEQLGGTGNLDILLQSGFASKNHNRGFTFGLGASAHWQNELILAEKSKNNLFGFYKIQNHINIWFNSFIFGFEYHHFSVFGKKDKNGLARKIHNKTNSYITGQVHLKQIFIRLKLSAHSNITNKSKLLLSVHYKLGA